VQEQSTRTTRANTAYLPYWTGILEVNGTLGKFTLVPEKHENYGRSSYPGDQYLTHDWRKRQAGADIAFRLHWIPYLDESSTPLANLTSPWKETHSIAVAELRFPRIDPGDEDGEWWAELAAEMDANPANWVSAPADKVCEPATEFELARKFAYASSASGRNALAFDEFRDIFSCGRLDASLVTILRTRRERKRALGHIDRAPTPPQALR